MLRIQCDIMRRFTDATGNAKHLMTIGLLVTAIVLMASVPFRTRVLASQVQDTASEFSYRDLSSVLRDFVDDDGQVDYRNLKAHADSLGAFSSAAGSLDRALYESWDEKEQLAFWINSYNAFTLQAIIDHYPIQSSFLASLRFPKNSIRQISGVWDELQFEVMGQKLTLDQIEHEILRRKFTEPRIHMALVCAAMSCPPLRNEPYQGHILDLQLDDQTRRFLRRAANFRIDRSQNTVYLSKILDWYGEDFVETYGSTESFSRYETIEGAVLNFISGYLSVDDQKFLSGRNKRVEYQDYDWSLNERTG